MLMLSAGGFSFNIFFLFLHSTFIGGCVVCKEICCCGINRNDNCQRKFHCYKKCPAMKKIQKKRVTATAKQNATKQNATKQNAAATAAPLTTLLVAAGKANEKTGRAGATSSSSSSSAASAAGSGNPLFTGMTY